MPLARSRAAGKLAAPSPMSSAHLAAALLAEPEGFAAKAIAVAVAAPEQLYAALGTGPAERAENTGSAELLDLILDETAKDALKSAMKARTAPRAQLHRHRALPPGAARPRAGRWPRRSPASA